MYESKHLIAFMCNNPLVPCEWNPDTPAAQAIYETFGEMQCRATGIVVVRTPEPNEEPCLELECVSDTLEVHIILVSPFGCSILEEELGLRGDLCVPGIGPRIHDALNVVHAWSESYGWCPRCFPDTMGPTFADSVMMFQRACTLIPLQEFAL